MQETRSIELWVFSKMAHHSSLIPRPSQLFKMAVESNFPPRGSLWMSKSQPTCASRGLIPLGCPTPPSWGKPMIGALDRPPVSFVLFSLKIPISSQSLRSIWPAAGIVFRPLVKGNEALGTRLLPYRQLQKRERTGKE